MAIQERTIPAGYGDPEQMNRLELEAACANAFLDRTLRESSSERLREFLRETANADGLVELDPTMPG